MPLRMHPAIAFGDPFIDVSPFAELPEKYSGRKIFPGLEKSAKLKQNFKFADLMIENI